MAQEFTLSVYFEGLLDFILNENHADDVRLCVVLPDAPGHTGSVASEGDTTLGGKKAVTIDLGSRRIVLQVERNTSGASTPDFDFEKAVISGPIVGAVHMEKIAQRAVDKHLRVVSPAPPLDVVRSQLLIGVGGTFHLDPSSSPPKLELPANDLNGGRKFDIEISENMFMEVSSIVRARLIILPLTDDLVPISIHEIAPDAKGRAVIKLSHTCISTGTVKIGDPDDDFRFHYLLLRALPSGHSIKNMPVPIIRKFSGTGSNFVRVNSEGVEEIKPNGCNCAGTMALARPYNTLGKFMRISWPPTEDEASS